MRIRFVAITGVSVVFCCCETTVAQKSSQGLFGDIVIVQKESAEAKRVRLEWISDERKRISSEMQKFTDELKEIEKTVPRSVRDRDIGGVPSLERERAKKSFDRWASNNDPKLRAAVLRGPAINALLRVLGPIAHYRKARTGGVSAETRMPSVAQSNWIQKSDVSHFRLNVATSSGPSAEIRLNQMPLQIEWPPVLIERLKGDLRNITKARDEFVTNLGGSASDAARVESAELLDKSLALMQAQIQREKRNVVKDFSIDGVRRTQVHTELQNSLRYVESLRATVQRLRNAPTDYKVQRFEGGSVEEFLDYCYLCDMVFLESTPTDEIFYTRIFRLMQDYAHDVQFLEDWRGSVEQRVAELRDEDQKLVWAAAEQ